MAKKKARPARSAPGHSKRLDPADYGIDLAAILEEIKPNLAGMTHAEIGQAAGLRPMSVSHLLNGVKPPSLGALAALAKASGGRLSVRYERA